MNSEKAASTAMALPFQSCFETSSKRQKSLSMIPIFPFGKHAEGARLAQQ
jgi:hypothetical protein